MSVQPPAPCERAPASVVSQIEQSLATQDARLTIVQMVRSDQSFPRGFERPYFVAARTTADGQLPVTATWMVEGPGEGEAVPIDDFASFLTTRQKDLEPGSLGTPGTDPAFQEARQCVGTAVSLRERRDAAVEAQRRQEQAQREQEQAQPPEGETTQ